MIWVEKSTNKSFEKKRLKENSIQSPITSVPYNFFFWFSRDLFCALLRKIFGPFVRTKCAGLENMMHSSYTYILHSTPIFASIF